VAKGVQDSHDDDNQALASHARKAKEEEEVSTKHSVTRKLQ
jgi:hypothetical protein